ncbi:MAG: type II toxin-antitoxin system PemK/MazF family toxin [Defluviitaleaceae bacterium]|nr:type II toxin-antitoxin system PemK/MazF family toxin [Defluviitaleaceae bacterium]
MVKQGDIIKLNFDPQMGTEQKGSRPAIVVSNCKFHKITRKRAWVCPITRTDKRYPIHIPLDERTDTGGVVLCDQIKTVDLEARGFEFIEVAPDDILSDVLDVVGGLLTGM